MWKFLADTVHDDVIIRYDKYKSEARKMQEEIYIMIYMTKSSEKWHYFYKFFPSRSMMMSNLDNITLNVNSCTLLVAIVWILLSIKL